MLSMDFTLTVKGSSQKEIGYATLIRTQPGKLRINLTNDGQRLGKLNVRLAVESYVGQEKPQLFQWINTQVVTIPPKGMVPLTYEILPIFPGLISVAVYVTNAANNAVMAKRATDPHYDQGPVRWWFHVVDNISIETLRALRELVAAQREGTE